MHPPTQHHTHTRPHHPPTHTHRYDRVLVEGLPDWKQPLFYYRRVRKMGLLEMSALVLLFATVGHYVWGWAVYVEKQLVLVSGWVCVGVGCLRGEAARAGEWVGMCGGGLSIEWVASCDCVGWGTAVDHFQVRTVYSNNSYSLSSS